MKTTRYWPIVLLALTGSYALADGATGHTHSAGSAHLAQATPVVAATLVDGEVRKVDVKAQKLTLRHGRIASEHLDFKSSNRQCSRHSGRYHLKILINPMNE